MREESVITRRVSEGRVRASRRKPVPLGTLTSSERSVECVSARGHDAQRDVNLRKDRVFQVRTGRGEGEHRAVVVAGARDPQPREVRPAVLERGLHTRADHDSLEDEATQPGFGLDDHDLWVLDPGKVTPEREVLKHGHVLEQQIWHGSSVKGDMEPYGTAGMGLQELRYFVPPRRVLGRLTYVDGERERTASRTGKPVMVEERRALLLPPMARLNRKRAPEPRGLKRHLSPPPMSNNGAVLVFGSMYFLGGKHHTKIPLRISAGKRRMQETRPW